MADPANYNTPAVPDCDWEIIPADFDMSSVRWDYQADKFTFDGKKKSIQLKGLPESIEASYKGNTGTRAGEYTATATFKSNDSNFRAPEPFTIPWSIARANHNMHKVYWDYSQSFVYDGKPKKVELKGIPEGVTVSYENNEMVDAGIYKAVAHFETETDDYNIPEDMSCVWGIEKSDVDIRELRWDYSQAFTYDGSVKSVSCRDFRICSKQTTAATKRRERKLPCSCRTYTARSEKLQHSEHVRLRMGDCQSKL